MAKTTRIKHMSNPWMQDVINLTQAQKRIVPATGGEVGAKLIVNPQTGETEGITGFYTYQEVSKNKFLQLYSDGIRALTGLTSAGAKVFRILYNSLLNGRYGADNVALNYDLLDPDDRANISRSTFCRGITDLINCNIIAASQAINIYWINPSYIFYGKRLALVKEYMIEEDDQNAKNAITESNAKPDTTSAEGKPV